MSNEVIKLDKISAIQGTVGASIPHTQAWLNSVQVLYPGSRIITTWTKEDGSIPPVGEFWYGNKNGTLLGKSFIAIPITFRDHALQMKGSEVTLESYKRLPQRADEFSPFPVNASQEEKDFHAIEIAPKQDGKFLNRWGNDVLLWIPQLKVFATLYLHSANRSCTDGYANNLGKFCKLKVYTPPSAQQTYYLMECRPVADISTLDPAKEIWVPTDEAMVEEVTKFKNPSPRNSNNNMGTGIDGRPR